MIKRVFDIFVAVCALSLTWPLWIVAILGIKLSSPGPIFYLGPRVGRHGKVFQMHKFRTMHMRDDHGAVITDKNDTRIFRFGRFMRKSKIDELPQFWDVLRGKLSIVGPRPEDPKIVEDHYTDWMKETLSVRPGITSPGAVWGYTKMDQYFTSDDPERDYIEKIMPLKLSLEYVYVQRQGFVYDVKLIYRTVRAVFATIMGSDFPDPPEMQQVPKRLLT